jgi:hypothetical protein
MLTIRRAATVAAQHQLAPRAKRFGNQLSRGQDGRRAVLNRPQLDRGTLAQMVGNRFDPGFKDSAHNLIATQTESRDRKGALFSFVRLARLAIPPNVVIFAPRDECETSPTPVHSQATARVAAPASFVVLPASDFQQVNVADCPNPPPSRTTSHAFVCSNASRGCHPSALISRSEDDYIPEYRSLTVAARNEFNSRITT